MTDTGVRMPVVNVIRPPPPVVIVPRPAPAAPAAVAAPAPVPYVPPAYVRKQDRY